MGLGSQGSEGPGPVSGVWTFGRSKFVLCSLTHLSKGVRRRVRLAEPPPKMLVELLALSGFCDSSRSGYGIGFQTFGFHVHSYVDTERKLTA